MRLCNFAFQIQLRYNLVFECEASLVAALVGERACLHHVDVGGGQRAGARRQRGGLARQAAEGGGEHLKLVDQDTSYYS